MSQIDRELAAAFDAASGGPTDQDLGAAWDSLDQQLGAAFDAKSQGLDTTPRPDLWKSPPITGQTYSERFPQDPNKVFPAGEFVKGVGQGVNPVPSMLNALGGVADAVGMNTLGQTAFAVGKDKREAMGPPAKGKAGKFGQIVGNILPSAASLVASGGASAPILAYYGVQGAGGGIEDYRRTLEAKGQTPDDIEQLAVGIGYAAAEIVAEKIGLDLIGKLGTRAAGKLGNVILRGKANDAAKFLIGMAGISATEGSEEALTQVAQNAISNLYDERALTEGAWSAFKTGAAGGLLLGGPAMLSRQARAEYVGDESTKATLPSNPAVPSPQAVAGPEVGTAVAPQTGNDGGRAVAGMETGLPSNAGTANGNTAVDVGVSGTPGANFPATRRSVEPADGSATVPVGEFDQQAAAARQEVLGALEQVPQEQWVPTLMAAPFSMSEEQAVEVIGVLGRSEGKGTEVPAAPVPITAQPQQPATGDVASLSQQAFAAGDGQRISAEDVSEVANLATKSLSRMELATADPLQLRTIAEQMGLPPSATRSQILRAQGMGGRTIGNEDLANPAGSLEGKAVLNAVDEVRRKIGLPSKRPDDLVAAEAEALLSDAPRRAEFERRLTDGAALNDTETAAAKRMVDEAGAKAFQTGSLDALKEAVRIDDGYRQGGSKVAQALRQRRDFNEPAHVGNRRDVVESVIQPPDRVKTRMAILRKLGREDAANKLRDNWAEKGLPKLLAKLKKNGYDLAAWSDAEYADAGKVIKVLREASTLRSDPADWFFEFRIMAVLSRVRSHAANIIGNHANLGVEYALLRPIQASLNAFVRDPNSPTFHELATMASTLPYAFKRAAINTVNTFKTEQSVLGGREEGSKIDLVKPAIPGKLGRGVRVPGRLLLAEDEWSKSLSFYANIGAAYHRLAYPKLASGEITKSEFEIGLWDQMQNPSEAIAESAWKQAKKDTFTAELGKIGQSFLQMREASHQTFKYVPPLDLKHRVLFFSTLVNLGKRTIELSPLGLPKAIWDLTSGKPITKNRAMEIASQQIFAAGLTLIVMGLLDGEDENGLPWITGTTVIRNDRPGAKETAYATLPPKSIRMPNGTWISYSRLEPFAGVISMASDSYQAIKDKSNGAETEDVYKRLTRQILGVFSDKTMAESINQFMDLLTGEVTPTQDAARMAGSLIPGIAQDVAIVGPDDNQRRRPADPSARLQYDVTRTDAQPLISRWGEEVERAGGTGAAGWATRVFSPFQTSDANKGATTAQRLDLALMNWNRTRPAEAWNPDPVSPYVTINGQRRQFTEEAYEALARDTGKRAVTMLQGRNIDPANPSAADIKAMKSALERARELARRRLAQDPKNLYPDDR